jgi:uncharacterized Zn finger protein (UPF0148 family)
MFENIVRELQRLNGAKVSVPIEADEEGYLDKECPSESCRFNFKVKEEDWKELFKDEAVYCPLCRHEANADSWWTTEQVEQAKNQAMKVLESRIGKALDTDAREFNRKQPRDSFIKISMKVSGFKPYPLLLPIPARELMERKTQCEKCGARYSVIGSAYFCPCCGHNSAERTFDDSVEKILSKIQNTDIIRKAFAKIGKKDEGEVTIRSLIESALSDGVTAFQRLSEEIYSKMPSIPPAPFNVFQRIEDGSRLWKEACGKGYEDWLTPAEMNDLNLLFQKRHLLAHKDGIVDDKYIQKTGDTSYKVGQRIVIKDSDVRRLVELITKLAKEIRAIAGSS